MVIGGRVDSNKNVFLVLAFALVLVFSFGVVSSINITECMNITSPGKYVLQNDIIVDFSSGLDNCFLIAANNVTLNANGYKLKSSSGIGRGVYGDGIFDLKIKDLFVENFGMGFYIINSRNISIVNSEFSLNGKGGYFYRSDENIVENTDFVMNDNEGLIFYQSDNNTLLNNLISSNGAGLSLSTAFGNFASNNSITFNEDYGFSVMASFPSYMNILTNNVLNNSQNVREDSNGECSFNSSGVGNYWYTPSGSGFSEICYDDNDDGICDSVYDTVNDERGCTSGSCDYFTFANEVGQNKINVISNFPLNSTNDVFNSLNLSVEVVDASGDNLNVTFYDGFDDSIIGEVTNVSSNSTVNVGWLNLDLNRTYEWYVNVTDGVNSYTSEIWSFTTFSRELIECKEIKYPGNYVLQKDIFRSYDACFNVTTSNVVFDGGSHVVMGDGLTIGNVPKNVGVYAYNVSNVTVKNIIISDFQFGVAFEDVNFSKLVEIEASNCREAGVLFRDDYIIDSNFNNSLINSSIYRNDYDGDTLGIDLEYAKNSKIIDNDIYSNGGDGVEIFGGSMNNNYFEKNFIYANGKNGINVRSSDTESFVNNTFVSNFESGISIYDSANNLFVGNLFSLNSLGLDADGANNKVYGNFFNNSKNVNFGAVSVEWNNSIKGNYWSSLNSSGYSDFCVDSDENGICDFSYDIENDSQGCGSSYCDYMPMSDFNFIEDKGVFLEEPLNKEVSIGENQNLSVRPSSFIENSSFNVYFYNAEDDSLIGERVDIQSGELASISWNNLDFYENYEWYVVVDDGENSIQSSTWEFEAYGWDLKHCKLIEIPGVYSLSNDIIDITGNCFNIVTDDVVVDGNGYSISGTGLSSRGVYSEGAKNVTVRNFGSFDNFRNGIYFENVLEGKIYGNNFVSLVGGMSILYSENLEVFDNFMEDVGSGIYVLRGGNNLIYDNLIVNSDRALVLYSKNNIIEGNAFSLNEMGVTFSSISNENLLYDNFLNNKENVHFYYYYDDYGMSQEWNNSLGGNYWSDARQEGFSDSCLDSDEDGVCDVVYDVRNGTQGCDSNDCDYMPLTQMPFKIAPAYLTLPDESEEVSEESQSNGGSTNEKVTFIPTEKELIEGYSKKVVSGHEVVVRFEGNDYLFDVGEVSEDGLVLSFDGESKVIEKDSSYSMDLNGDGKNDLKVTLLDANSIVANLEYQFIIPNSDYEEDLDWEEAEEVSEIEEDSVVKNNVWPYIVLGVVLLAVGAWFVLNRKKK